MGHVIELLVLAFFCYVLVSAFTWKPEKHESDDEEAAQ